MIQQDVKLPTEPLYSDRITKNLKKILRNKGKPQYMKEHLLRFFKRQL